MKWLKRIFGNVGTVRFEAITNCRQSIAGKMQIESFGLNREEVEQKIKNVIFVERGIRCSKLKIIGYHGS